MLWNGDGGVLEDVTCGLGCSLLGDEAAETSKINVLVIFKRLLDDLHERFVGLDKPELITAVAGSEADTDTSILRDALRLHLSLNLT